MLLIAWSARSTFTTCCAPAWSKTSMLSTPSTEINADIRERASRIKLLCFDVDGTLTDGRLHYDSEGRESKDFHVLDGQGMVLLKRFGIPVVFITARNSASAAHRAADLGLQAFI